MDINAANHRIEKNVTILSIHVDQSDIIDDREMYRKLDKNGNLTFVFCVNMALFSPYLDIFFNLTDTIQSAVLRHIDTLYDCE